MPTGPRWLALLLLASLGGNMFLGGFLVGHRSSPFPEPPFFGGPPGPPPGAPSGPLGPMERLLERLPAEDAVTVRKIFEPHMAMLAEVDKRHRGFPQEVRIVLGAEPFDKAAFAAMLERNDTAERQLHEKMRGLIVDSAAALSPEGRRRLLMMVPEHGGPGGGPGGDLGGPRERR